jgi:hypothetical protein
VCRFDQYSRRRQIAGLARPAASPHLHSLFFAPIVLFLADTMQRSGIKRAPDGSMSKNA